MKPLFFGSPDLTDQQGIALNEPQTASLQRLLEEVCKLDHSPLACRIALQLKTEAVWHDVRVRLEDEVAEESGHSMKRLHVIFPLQECIGQMELYTWQNDQSQFCIGLGTSDCTDFALERLRQGKVRELAVEFFEELRGELEQNGESGS